MGESLDGMDLTDLDTFAQGFPHDLFRRHRAVAPVWWHAPTSHTPDGEGFWSVATYDEVLRVLNDPVTFSSETGGDRPYGGHDHSGPAGGRDRAEHDGRPTARRASGGWSPRASRRRLCAGWRTSCVGGCGGCSPGVDAECDFLTEVAAELPMQAICVLLGVPEADRHQLFAAVEHIFDIPDESDFLSMSPQRQQAVDFLARYGTDLIAEKRAHPGPDMLSVVIHAHLPDADPPVLSQDELAAFFSLLFSAGCRDHPQRDCRVDAGL